MRGYTRGKDASKRLTGMVVRLDDGTVRTFGVPKGRYSDWESKDMKLNGMEYDHLDRPIGISFL